MRGIPADQFIRFMNNINMGESILHDRCPVGPEYGIKNSTQLQRLKMLNISMLKKRNLDLKELMFVLIYKLSDYVGFFPYKLANDTNILNWLDDDVEKFFNVAKRASCLKTADSIEKNYKIIVKKITSAVEKNYNGFDLKLDRNFSEFKRRLSRAISRAKSFVVLATKRRNLWISMICKLYKLDPQDLQKKYNSLIADDPATIALERMSNILGIANITEDEERFCSYVFYTCKLSRGTKVGVLKSVDPKHDEFNEFKKWVGFLLLPDNIESIINDRNVYTEYFLTEETRKKIDGELGNSQSQGGEGKPNESEQDGVDRAPYDDTNLQQKGTSSKNWEKAKPRKEAAQKRGKHLFFNTRMRYYISKLAAEQDEKKLDEKINELAAKYFNDKDSGKQSFIDTMWKEVKYKQFVTRYKSVLKKCFSTTKRYGKEKQGRENFFEGNTSAVCHIGLSTSNFDVFTRKVFDNYYDIKNEQATENEQKSAKDRWVSTYENKMEAILNECCFDIESDLSSDATVAGTTAHETQTISIRGEIKTLDSTGKKWESSWEKKEITVPISYLDLKNATMKILREMFQDSKKKWSEISKKLDEWKASMKKSDYEEHRAFSNEISASLVGNTDIQRRAEIGRWRDMVEGHDSKDYEKIYDTILRERDFDLRNARGKSLDILSFIWAMYIEYNPENRSKQFESYVAKLDKKIEELKSEVGQTSKPNPEPPGELPQWVIEKMKKESSASSQGKGSKTPPSEPPKEAFAATGMKPPVSSTASKGDEGIGDYRRRSVKDIARDLEDKLSSNASKNR